MGAYSTMGITKEDALREIEKWLPLASNNQLEDILCALFSKTTIHNFSVGKTDSGGVWAYTSGALYINPDMEND